MIITTKQGDLRGKKNTTVLGPIKKPFYSFYGIPYAIPPVKELRFQAPKPFTRWEGVYDATRERNHCIQKLSDGLAIHGSEDCLYLNVHTPVTSFPASILKPVMVFIHGGSFEIGSGSEKYQAPNFLMDYDVILVAMNYRLHVLGFLNLGLLECPGNVGLKDQRLALMWVKENISFFGGDPENVTIFGQSAGATSVHYHMISPFTKGLFHKAILQSGSTMTTWALNNNPVETAFCIGRELGYNGSDRLELLTFMKSCSAKKLIDAGIRAKEKRRLNNENAVIIFAPSVEILQDEAIIPIHPRILLQSAPVVPTIYGCNSLEGLIGVGSKSESDIQKSCDDITLTLKRYFAIDDDNLQSVASQVKQYYFYGQQTRNEKLTSLSNLLTDIFFFNFEESIENIYKSSSPPYVYEFTYDGGLNMMKAMYALRASSKFFGACHGDELGYLFYFKMIINYGQFSESDLRVIKNMCSMWSNFAKSGNPLMDIWKPYTEKEPCFLRIDSDPKLIKGHTHGERRQFLKNLLRSYPLKIFL